MLYTLCIYIYIYICTCVVVCVYIQGTRCYSAHFYIVPAAHFYSVDSAHDPSGGIDIELGKAKAENGVNRHETQLKLS